MIPADQDPWDRIEEIASCQDAVCDLMVPDLALQRDNRSRVAMLLGFLRREQELALVEARKGC